MHFEKILQTTACDNLRLETPLALKLSFDFILYANELMAGSGEFPSNNESVKSCCLTKHHPNPHFSPDVFCILDICHPFLIGFGDSCVHPSAQHLDFQVTFVAVGFVQFPLLLTDLRTKLIHLNGENPCDDRGTGGWIVIVYNYPTCFGSKL